jgi:UDP-N-acetylglucosamine 2-epimerase (hydrolysing)
MCKKDQKMSDIKEVAILTGTRADWGKLQLLVEVLDSHSKINVSLIISGMHLSNRFGSTYLEVERKFPSIKKFYVQNLIDDVVSAAESYTLFEAYLVNNKPDYVFIHGDRLEPLVMATVCCVNSIPTYHLEGGESSGTQDEMFRHAISKLASFHLPSHESAAGFLRAMGEPSDRILTIGSLDLEYDKSKSLPSIEETKNRYGISFNSYHVLSIHPVTTNKEETIKLSNLLHKLCTEMQSENFIIIYPNNDQYSDLLISGCNNVAHLTNVLAFPSIRFEYYLSLLKNSKSLIGNSSAGIREMPALGKPSINIGTRQKNRDIFDLDSIYNVEIEEFDDIIGIISKATKISYEKSHKFTVSNVADRLEVLLDLVVNSAIGVQK